MPPLCCLVLKLSLATFAGSVSADAVTTHQMLSGYPMLRERNPLVSSVRDRPAAAVSVMLAEDVVGTWLAVKYLAPKHPKLVAVGFFAASAVRTYFAYRNVQNMRLVDRQMTLVRTFP